MESFAISVAKQSLMIMLLLAAPPVLAAMVIGLMVSLLQATTQVQEQTLTFVPKMVAVVGIVGLLGPMGMSYIVQFTKNLFESFPNYIH